MHPTLPLVAGRAEVEIVPSIGGAIARFRVAGTDVLRPAPDAAIADGDVRAMGCYPLVPYSNRIANAKLRVGERTFQLARNFGDHPHAIHGVGWQRPWTIVAREARSATLAFSHSPRGDDARAWPFAFHARQSFALDALDGAIAFTSTLSIASEDDRPFPFGLGFHPFFVRTPDARLAFRAAGVWRTDQTVLPIAHASPPPEWRFDPARTLEGVAIDNVFTGWDGRASVEWPRRDLQVAIDADHGLAFLVVYLPPAATHLAMEPVTHMTDAFNRAARGEPATGARTLGPGESFSCTMRLTVSRLSE